MPLLHKPKSMLWNNISISGLSITSIICYIFWVLVPFTFLLAMEHDEEYRDALTLHLRIFSRVNRMVFSKYPMDTSSIVPWELQFIKTLVSHGIF